MLDIPPLLQMQALSAVQSRAEESHYCFICILALLPPRVKHEWAEAFAVRQVIGLSAQLCLESTRRRLWQQGAPSPPPNPSYQMPL